MAAIVFAGVASACSDADSGRRFANEPLPSVAAPTETAASKPGEHPGGGPSGPGDSGVPGGDQPAPPAPDVLDVRGAPERIYFLAGTELWAIRADGQDPHPVYVPRATETIRGVAASPGVAADEVAVLVTAPMPASATPAPAATAERATEATPVAAATPVADPPETTSLVILDATGSELRRLDDLGAALGAADASAGSPRAVALSWSPQGGVVLVTFSSGIVAVPADGDPYLLLPTREGRPVGAWLSPAGDAVAVLIAEAGTEQGRLYLAEVEAGMAATPVPIAPEPDGVAGVTRAGWLPDGSGLLYTQARPGGFAGGDLYRLPSDGGEPTLVASAGRAAPVADVADFTIAPDGRAVAYVVTIPDGSGTGRLFHSLWVQEIEGPRSFPVPVSAGLAVSHVWWTDGGLVWRADAAGTGTDGSFTIERLDLTGAVTVIYASSPPAATPAASPVAGPLASPPATPGVLPIASPPASPMAAGSPAAGATPMASPRA